MAQIMRGYQFDHDRSLTDSHRPMPLYYYHEKQSLGWRKVKDELHQVQTPYFCSLFNRNNGRRAVAISDIIWISISILKQT